MKSFGTQGQQVEKWYCPGQNGTSGHFIYDANRPAILKWNLMGLGMDGNRYTQSYQISFQDCWSDSIIHKLPDSTPDHISHQFEIVYQLVLQSHRTPGLNIR